MGTHWVRQRSRFSLFLVFVVFTAVIFAFGYLNVLRTTGRQRFVEVIRQIEFCDPAPSSSLRFLRDQEDPSSIIFLSDEHDADSDPDNAVEGTLLEVVMADAEQVVGEVNLKRAKLTVQTTREFVRTRAADQVHTLRLVNCEIDVEAEPFFASWPNLTRVILVNTPVDLKWVKSLAQTQAKRLIVVGECGELTGQALSDQMDRTACRIEEVHVCNRNTTSAQLEQWSSKSGVTFRAIADTTCPTQAPVGPLLSDADPTAQQKMSSIFVRIQNALDKLDPPGLNQFNPPATDAEIARLETVVGVPLHPTLRALLKLHNGQPTVGDELVSMERLLPVDMIIEELGEWSTYPEREELDEYDFDFTYDSWVNPNVVPIGTSEDHVIGVHLITGKLVHWYSEQRHLDYHADDLIHYFEQILAKLEKAEVERWPEDYYDKRKNKVNVYFPPLILR